MGTVPRLPPHLGLVAALALGCGARTEPLDTGEAPSLAPIRDAGAQVPPENVPEGQAPEAEAPEAAALPPPPDFDAACAGESAPTVSVEQYAGLLCQGEFECAGAPAGTPSLGTLDLSGCAKLVELRASSELTNQLCVNVCAQYLELIQQGGPACTMLLSGGPPECVTAFVSPSGFTYCSQSEGRLTPDVASSEGIRDGVWCPSDAQCVTRLASGGPWICLE